MPDPLFDSLYQSADSDAKTQAVSGALGSPDKAAQALDLQGKTGVPASVAEQNPDQILQQYHSRNASEAMTNPALRGYVTSNPMAAKVSGDDWPALQKSSKTLDGYIDGNLHSALVNGPLQAIRRLSGAFEGAKEGAGDKPLAESISAEDWANHPIWAAVLSPLIYGIEGSKKAIGAGVGAASGYSYYWAKDAGMSDADAGRFARDIGIFATGAMVESGIGPKMPHYVSAIDAAAEKAGETVKGVTPEAAQSVAAGEVPRPGADPSFDKLHEIQQKVDSVKVDRMIEDAEGSKTRERSPELYSDFVKEHGTGNESISIPAEKIVEASKGKALNEGPFKYIPGIEDQVSHAIETGTEVKIPLADYVANTDSALHESLKDSIRFREEGVSGEEAKELGKEEKPATEQAYHGTTAPDFQKFDLAKSSDDEAIYFSSNPKTAAGYAGEAMGYPEGARIYPTELPINEKTTLFTTEKKLLESFKDGLGEPLLPKLIEQAKAEGKSIIKIERQSGEAEYAVLNPDVIKPRFITEKLNNEARSIATAAIQQRDALYLKPLINDAEALALTDSEFKRYSNLIERSQNEIITRAIAAAEREVKKPLTEEWKKNEKATRFQAEKEALARPEIAADRFLRTGELPNGQRLKLEGKLDAATVEGVLGKEHSLGNLTQKNGVFPDDIAPLLGFENGRSMLKAINEYNYGRNKQGLTPQAYLKALIDKDTQAQMRAQHGLLPENILAEARDIALSDVQGELFDTEIHALARKGGFEVPVSKEVLRDKARGDFANLTLDKVPTETAVRRAIEKGGRTAEKELLGGKYEEALKAKLAQRQAYWMWKELKDFQKDQAKLGKNIKTIADDDSAKRVDSDHLMQARRLLNQLGVDGGKVPDNMPPFSQFVENADGRIAAADWLTLNEGMRTSVDQLTVDEVRGLQNTLQSILHVGRDAKKIDLDYASAVKDDVIRDAIGELNRFKDIPSSDIKGVTNKTRVAFRTVSAPHMLFERLLDYTDKYAPNGPFSRYVDRPLREAYGQYLKYQEKIVGDIKELKKYTDNSVTDEIENTLIKDPRNDTLNGGNLRMDHHNLRRLMLYMGSKSGREKAIRGFFQAEGEKPLDPMEIDFLGKKLEKMVADNATKNDVNFVNKVFGIHEKLLPDIQALEMKETGVPMDKVEPRSYDTPNGKVDGGYIKVRYDKNRSSIEEDLRSKNSIQEEGYRRITTAHSYTKSRTGYTGYVDLDMSLFSSELASEVHDLAFRSPIRQVEKLLNDHNLMNELRQAWGDEYGNLFSGWLRDIANANTVDDQYARGLVNVLAQFRKNVVSTFVGFNIGTAEKHGLSAAAMSVREVGLKDFVSNVKERYQDAKDLVDQAVKLNPEHAEYLKGLMTEKGMRQTKFALNSSPILRNRIMKYNESIYGAYREATETGPWAAFRTMRDWTQQAGRWPISFLDTVSTIPEWLAAYKREIALTGDHDTAVYSADKAVSRSHGSSFVGDSPAILRNKNSLPGEVMRWATPLYKFWNHNLMQLTAMKWDASAMIQGRSEPGTTVPQLAHALFWAAVIPAIAEEISAPPLDHKKGGEDVLKATGRFLGSHFIGFREITNWVLDGHEPSVGFIGSVAHSLGQAAKTTMHGGRNAIENAVTALGLLTGVGTRPAGAAIQYGAAVATGRESPSTPNQVLQGIRTGSQRPRRF